jgi:hypothetical protein
MVDEFGLQVIDGTLPIAEQQRQVRAIVEPHLKGLLRRPDNVFSFHRQAGE